MKGKDHSSQYIVVIKMVSTSGFGFYDHRTFEDQGLLGRDVIALAKWGKSTFVKRQANLIRRALNQENGGVRLQTTVK